MGMITTLFRGVMGEMDEAVLVKRETHDENENEAVDAVEYYFQGELVHRSANVQLKRWPEGVLEAGLVQGYPAGTQQKELHA